MKNKTKKANELNQRLLCGLRSDERTARKTGLKMLIWRMGTREGLVCPGCHLIPEDFADTDFLPAAPCLASEASD